MYNPAAQRLWAVARQKCGSITADDVSNSDILQGRANGWLRGVGIGHFEATEELRRVAAFSSGTADPAFGPHVLIDPVATTSV